MNITKAIVAGLIFATAITAEGKVKDDYIARRDSVRSVALHSEVFDRDLTPEQRNALEFLYAYMPLPDVTDYSGDFFLKNVDQTLRTRSEMPWGKVVPDREFYHFVLPLRVNNEPLDDSRGVFYGELKERVKNLSMAEAILEVNHWCHEKATYQPSDGRTHAPMMTVYTGIGRCGEESTF
ncbi:MAG: transglutaminase domain-containing protein, partial [Muribaculaceae bacterium]|nr:transglutaminase domain-containing protein [Muribaculaceae bacterium]